MLKSIIPALLAVFYLSCHSKQGNTNANAAPAADTLRYEMRSFVKHYCVNDEQCADFNIIYPDIVIKDSSAAEWIRQALQERILAGVGAESGPSLVTSLDSAAARFIDEFVQLKRDFPQQEAGHTMQMTGSVLFNTPKAVTFRLDFNWYTGGAHPNAAVAIISFDRGTGRELPITALLTDTNAVRPMLEAAYKKDKGLDPTDDITQLLYPGLEHLPMPVNAGIVPEGIIFAYSDYEVAPHAVGPMETILSWEQLEALADRQRWAAQGH
ncbi:MAG: DUF4163 domain-containing protein [Saprospiraceae bacterium]